jgi:hypothetical protein
MKQSREYVVRKYTAIQEDMNCLRTKLCIEIDDATEDEFKAFEQPVKDLLALAERVFEKQRQQEGGKK